MKKIETLHNFYDKNEASIDFVYHNRTIENK